MAAGSTILDGQKLAMARASKGWSQAKLAGKADVSTTSVEKAEAGGAIRFEIADKILSWLGLELEDVQVTPLKLSDLLLPPRPESVIGRNKTSEEIIQSLENGRQRLVLYGLPGIGKTTIACELAYSIFERYRDGIFWTTIGNQVTEHDILSKLLEWTRQLDLPGASLINSIDEASNKLRSMFSEKQSLIIIDDVWEISHAIPFCVSGPKCGILVTTRSTLIAEELWPEPASRHRLDGLSEEDSLELLRLNAGTIVDKNIEQCRSLVQTLSGLPAAIHVAGKMLNSQQSRGQDIEQLIADLSVNVSPLLDRIIPTRHGYVAEDASSTVFALIDKSYQSLNPETKYFYACLRGFPPSPSLIPIDDLEFAWEQDDTDTIKTIDKLVDAGLLEPAGTDNDGVICYRAHALIIAHADSLDMDNL